MQRFGRSFRPRRRAPAELAPARQGQASGWSRKPGSGRYLAIPEIDRWRATPFSMPPDPVRGAVLDRVRQLVDALDGAVDEGTGAALDRLIECWVAAWISTVEASYADHCAVISVHGGQASQWLAESARTLRDEDAELDRIRAAFLACQARLSGVPVPPELAAAGAGREPA